jgi:hypothetical protein
MPLLPRICLYSNLYGKRITICEALLGGRKIFHDMKHPLAHKSNGTVYLHRHIMSIFIGRWIDVDEHVHHIDGDGLNNRISNLVLLTKSEHTAIHNRNFICFTHKCKHCNKIYTSKYKDSTYCSPECFSYGRKIFDITKEELSKLVWSLPMREVGKLYNVSDNAIKHRCIKMNIQWPPRGYWNKK